MTVKNFTKKVLDGLAIGIVVALIPNAVLSAFLKPYASNETVNLLLQSLVIMQALCSAVVGMLVGLQFGIKPMKASMIAAATFISSGVVKITPDGLKLLGVGDLINVTIFAAIAVLVTLWLDNKLGSLTIVFQPIIVGGVIGFLGLLTLPYVSMITKFIGDIIINFTTLQPLIMSILITASFAILIISPISTVAIGFAIGLDGLSSGAANMGVTVTAAVLVIGSLYAKNKSGVTLAALLGAMKMFIPNIVQKPIMYLPILTTSIAGAFGVKFLGIMGTFKTAGFGIVGLIGPIEAYRQLTVQSMSMPLIRILLAYLVIPFGVAWLSHILFTKVLKLYSSDIYKFEN